MPFHAARASHRAPLRGRVRQLHGQEYRRAAKLLRRKHPFLPGLAVPLLHRAMRGKFGRTVHFEFAPDPAATPGDTVCSTR